MYHAGLDAFLYIANTDNSNGSTGTLGNRVVGSLVDAFPDANGKLGVRSEQPLADGLPAGQAEGHPAALMNPFNGQLMVVRRWQRNRAGRPLVLQPGQRAELHLRVRRGRGALYMAGAGGNPSIVGARNSRRTRNTA